jgi:soluble lytic murein transglycosylase-like protein
MRTPLASSRLRIVTGIAALYAVPAATVAIAAAPAESVDRSQAVIAAADHLDYPTAAPPAGGDTHEALAVQTPAPTPAPTPVATPAAPHPPRAFARAARTLPRTLTDADHASIRAIITAAAVAHGVNPAWMLAIAACESGLNPRAVEPHGHYGLFQFLPSTYAANGGHDLYDPVEQARVTATMLAHGQAWQWACANR